MKELYGEEVVVVQEERGVLFTGGSSERDGDGHNRGAGVGRPR